MPQNNRHYTAIRSLQLGQKQIFKYFLADKVQNCARNKKSSKIMFEQLFSQIIIFAIKILQLLSNIRRSGTGVRITFQRLTKIFCLLALL